MVRKLLILWFFSGLALPMMAGPAAKAWAKSGGRRPLGPRRRRFSQNFPDYNYESPGGY
jgi:hypothetical protein